MGNEFINIFLKPQFKEFLPVEQDQELLNETVQLSLAIGLYVEKKVSVARAAELAGKSLADFIKILSKHNIPWSEYTTEIMEQDDEALDYIRSTNAR